MKKNEYKWRPSTLSRREQIKRNMLLVRRMRAEGNEADLRCLEPESEDGKLLASAEKASDQRNTIRHTSRGDFCQLHTNPLIIK